MVDWDTGLIFTYPRAIIPRASGHITIMTGATLADRWTRPDLDWTLTDEEIMDGIGKKYFNIMCAEKIVFGRNILGN